MKRKRLLILVTGLILLGSSALTAQNKIIVNNSVPGMTINRVSENGKYVVGSQLAAQGLLWEPENENKITLLNELTEGSKCEGVDVTNDGMVVGYKNVERGKDGMPAYWKDGKWTMLPCPNADDIHGSAQTVSTDGAIILGYTSHLDYVCTPCLWRRNSEGKYDVEVIAGTETDQVGMDPKWGFLIDDMSLDGKVWSGRLYDHDHQIQGVLWDPEPMIYGKELFYDEDGNIIYGENGMTMDFQYAIINKISPNGRYITGPTMKTNEDGGIVHKPFVYDREKDKFIFINVQDAIGSITSSDGLTFYSTPIQALTRDGFVYNNETKKTETMQDWLFNNYQLDLGAALEFGGLTGTIEDVNSDRSVMVGNIAITTDYRCFWIKMETGLGVDSEISDKLSFSVNGNKLYVSGEPEKVTVFEPTGRKVYEATVTESIIDLGFLRTGIYLVTISNKGEVLTQKTVIR